MVKLKCLVDYKTCRVLWMSNDMHANMSVIDPETRIYKFVGNTNIVVWDEFYKYSLFLDKTLKLYTDPHPGFADKTVLMARRAKAFAFEFLQNGVASHYERYGYSHNTLYEHLRTEVIDENSKWVKFYMQQNGCDVISAVKYINFMVEEYESTVFFLESTRLKAIEKLKVSSTLAEVDEIYHEVATQLMYNPLKISKLKAVTG